MIRALLLVPAALLLLGSSLDAAPAQRITLPNGLRVIVEPNSSTDIVAIELLLDVSAADEPAEKSGLRYLVQRLLLRGTKEESGQSMGRRLAAVGGVVDATVGLDYVEIYALVPAEGFEVALELLAAAACDPAFAPEEVRRQKVDAQELARAAREEPFQETYLAFREGLYGDHPYGRATLGMPSTLSSITRDDIVSFYREHYVARRAVLAICGGVGKGRVLRAARDLFGEWRSGAAALDRAGAVSALQCSVLVARERPLRRTHLILGFLAPAADESEYYAVHVLDSILGGGAGARLPRKLREELGLVYHVSSFYPTLAADSHFGIYAATEAEHLETVKRALLVLLTDLASDPVPEEELERAKHYLLGSYALSHQRMKDQAYSLAWYETLGLGQDFEDRYKASVGAVTPGQVQETAQSLLRRFVLAVTMPTI